VAWDLSHHSRKYTPGPIDDEPNLCHRDHQSPPCHILGNGSCYVWLRLFSSIPN
jgi:hypothetical protein